MESRNEERSPTNLFGEPDPADMPSSDSDTSSQGYEYVAQRSNRPRPHVHYAGMTSRRGPKNIDPDYENDLEGDEEKEEEKYKQTNHVGYWRLRFGAKLKAKRKARPQKMVLSEDHELESKLNNERDAVDEATRILVWNTAMDMAGISAGDEAVDRAMYSATSTARDMAGDIPGDVVRHISRVRGMTLPLPLRRRRG